MSFRLSKERKKRRYARRKAKRHLAALSKPAKPAKSAPPAPKPAPAKPAPAANPTSPPKNTPSTPKPATSMSLARRAAHRDHKMRARVRLLEKQVARFTEHEKHLAGVLAQLAAARTQIRELNVAMHHVLSQPPHNGRYFDKVGRPCPRSCLFALLKTPRADSSSPRQNYNKSCKWGRTLWECPVSWDHSTD